MNKPGTQGVCKTHYVISEDTKAERIHLSKTKDLNHCQERIIKDIGLAYVERCPECEAVRVFSISLIKNCCQSYSSSPLLMFLLFVGVERKDLEGSCCL